MCRGFLEQLLSPAAHVQELVELPAQVYQNGNHGRGRRKVNGLLSRVEALEQIQKSLDDKTLTVRECMPALRVMGERSLWQHGINLLASIASRGLQPDQFMFNKLISLCTKNKAALPSLELLGDMVKRRIYPDVQACNMVIGALAPSGLWEEALEVLQSMKRYQAEPDTISVNSAIAACAGGSRWVEAIQLLGEGQHLNSGPDVWTYGSTIRACEAKWILVLQLLDEMQARKIQPNEVISASAINACAKSSPESSIEIFRSLKQKGVRQNTLSYQAALSACHVDKYLWSWSLLYLEEMKAHGIKIDIGILNAVMGACQNAHYWGHLQKQDANMVQRVLNEVYYLRLVPNIVTYSHIMAAAKQAGDWERVLQLLNEACIQKLQPDAILYTHSISACAAGRSWEQALQLLNAANQIGGASFGLGSDFLMRSLYTSFPLASVALHFPVAGSLEFHWSSAMKACVDATQWESAIALVPRMRNAHLQPEVVTYTEMMCAYLHGGAWPAVLELLDEMHDQNEEPNHISLTSVIRACMVSGNTAFAVMWKLEMEKLGVQPYFTTYVYLIALAADAQEWPWVEFLLAEAMARYPNAENFDLRELYNLVLLKCLKHSSWSKALKLWQDYPDSGVSSPNAALATCENVLEWDEFVHLCGEFGPAGWVQEVSEAALRATVALARGKYTGHGPGWQQNALGQVAMTMDLLAWHGLFAANLNRHFADQVLEFVLEAVIADTDETVLSKAATGRTHTRLKEPILKGSQLQNVMLSSAFTRQALQSLELAAFETWLPNARLRARRELPAEDAGGGLDDAIRNLRARWISFRPSKQCAGGLESAGFVVLAADAGCKEWLASHALENALARVPQHGNLLRDVVQASALQNGKVRMYMSYIPCLACLAKLYQLQKTGTRLEVAFDTWRETRHWTC
ncbi:unnamed protein product [Durusdinium trenchii]|uniref:Uncharacterized protein n=1 Tax=Durusdinium trenchii TaxID=1381693 RepID=A0ABP0K8Y1_9DINO